MRVVRHHSHFKTTSNFLNACHSLCNLRLQKTKKVCVVFHGLRNYDSKFLLRALCKTVDTNDIKIIASNTEKFTEISTPRFVFRDSYLLMSESLEKLVKNLGSQGTDAFVHLREEMDS